MLRRFPLASLAAILAGCAAPADPDTAIVTDSAGIRVVTSPAADRPLPMSFTELRRIGGADSGAAAFTDASTRTVRTGGDDRIIVLDRDRSVIAIFDSTGRPVASFGRRGAGPGEFAMAFNLIDVGTGGVAVFDFAKQALVRWDSDGQVLPEERLDPAAGAWNALIRRGDTTILALQDADSIRTEHRVVAAVGSDTTVLASMIGPPARTVEFNCVALMMPPLFAGRFAVASADDRLLVARQDRYRVDVYRDGRLEASLRRELEPVATTEDDARRMYPEGWTVRFGGGGGCTVDGVEVAEKAGMLDRLPVIADVGFGPDGTIWVRRHTFPGDPRVTDVFDAGGAYLGTVTGRGLPLGWLGRDRILFPIEDEATGVTQIGVFTITREGGEGAGTT